MYVCRRNPPSGPRAEGESSASAVEGKAGAGITFLSGIKRKVVKARGLVQLPWFPLCSHSEYVFIYISLIYYDFCVP